MTVRESLHTILTFLMTALIVSFCGGAAAYLVESSVKAPLMAVDYQGELLFFSMAGEEWTFDLTVLERIAQMIQQLWLFLPPKFRLAAQGIVFLIQNI